MSHAPSPVHRAASDAPREAGPSEVTGSAAPLDLTDGDRLARIERRVAEIERLYRQWAREAKHRYRLFNILTIGFAAAVPVVALLPSLIGADPKASWVSAAAGILGAAATFSRSIDSLYKTHETWLRNDDAYGKLRSERFLFEQRSGPYRHLAQDDLIPTYAERVDALISAQTGQWIGAEHAPPDKR